MWWSPRFVFFTSVDEEFLQWRSEGPPESARDAPRWRTRAGRCVLREKSRVIRIDELQAWRATRCEWTEDTLVAREVPGDQTP